MRVGDFVRASYTRPVFNNQDSLEAFMGVVTSIEEKTSLFSDKYAILEKETVVEVLCDGKVKTFVLEEDNIEVVYENR